MKISLLMTLPVSLLACTGSIEPLSRALVEVEPTQATQPLEAWCDFDAAADPEQRVMAVGMKDHVLWIHADGSTSVAHHFGPIEGDWSGTGELVARGPYLVASVTQSQGNAYIDPDPETNFSKLVLLNTEGELLLSRVMRGNNRHLRGVFLSERGTLATSYGAQALLAQRDGRVDDVEDLYPMGEPMPDGSVPARRARPSGVYQDSPDDFGFWRPGSAELVQFTFPSASYRPTRVSDKLLYQTDLAGERHLVIEGLDGAMTLPLEANFSIEATHPAGWALLRAYGEESVLVVNVNDGTLRQSELRYPEGHTELYPFSGSVTLDGSGRLMVGLRDDYSAALFRSADGSSWERVGATMNDVLDIVGGQRAGTFMVYATNARYSYQEWPEPPTGFAPDLVGDNIQVARADNGFWDTLPPPPGGSCGDTWYEGPRMKQISPDGVCVAYWQHTEEDGLSLKVLDTRDGSRRALIEDVPLAGDYGYCMGGGDVTWLN